ncbi:hypothetical protein [Mucilaginibacter sp. HD30]
MKTKLMSPKWHAVVDYALISSLVVLPPLLKLNSKTRIIYAVEAALLIPYVALSKHPLAVKGLIPFKTHGRIDCVNVTQFAIQSMLPSIRKHKNDLAFNMVFTVLAGLNVLLTDWKSRK